MQRLGRVLHLSSSKKLILKAENISRIGEKVLDGNLKYVGTVSDVFGSVSSPYMAVKPEIKEPQKLVNQVLYAIPSNKTRRGKKKWEKN